MCTSIYIHYIHIYIYIYVYIYLYIYMVCTHVAAQTYTNRVAYLLPSIDLELKLADMR